MKYIMNEDDLRGFIQFIGAETKEKGKEIVFRHCPKCQGSAPKEDEWKFAVNRKTGAFGCFRGSCGYHGHFVELCRDFGYKIGMETEEDFAQFPQPEKRIKPRDTAIAYLQGRGISEATAERYSITAFEDRPKVLWIPLFNEYGKLVGAKERRMDWKKSSKFAKEVFTKGSKPVLFGMMQCEDFGTVVITEGMMDALSVAEAGVKNSVSVPNGMQGFSWVSYCYDWLKKFDEIVVFGDCEKGKVSLVDQIASRLPNRIRVVRNEDYLGEKDANDILTAFGPEAVRKCVENAEERTISHVKELADVKSKDLAKLPKIRTGIYELDKALKGGICFGQVLLLTGKRGDGKSTFGSNLVCESLDQGYKVFAYSGELPDYHFKGWLNSQLAGKDKMRVRENEFGEEEYYLDEETDRKISEWYRGKAYVYDNESIDGEEMESLTETIRKVVSQKNVRLVFIDNLMTAMDAVDTKESLYMAQSKFVDELKSIAIRYDVVVILVAHPRKAGKDEAGSSFDNDTVSGSGDITNRVDIVLNYSRAKDDDCDSKLQVGKNRLAGILKLGAEAIPLRYSACTKRVFGMRSLDKHYGWEREPVRVDDIDVPF